MKTTKETTATTFADLLRNYEKQASNPTDQTAYTNALVDLAKAVAYSVLKKCINTSQNPTLIQTRHDLTKDLHNLDGITHANNNAYVPSYNTDGEYQREIVDNELHKALTTLCGQSLGDGIDLVNDAVVAILAETEKASQTADGLTTNFMERPYTTRRLKRKVWIKTAESVDGWEDTTTTPIQETYKAVRRAIEHSRAVQTDPRNGYTYISDISTDPESGIDEIIYRRYGKYADIGGHATDMNGKIDYKSSYTADAQTATDYTDIIEKLNLTTRQAQIIELRMRGYGYLSIGTYLGVSDVAVINALKKVRNKCEKIGFTPDMWAEMTADK